MSTKPPCSLHALLRSIILALLVLASGLPITTNAAASAAPATCDIDLDLVRIDPKSPPPLRVTEDQTGGVKPRVAFPLPQDVTGLVNFLGDRFNAMAVDLAEDRVLNGICSDSSNSRQYFPKTCNAYKVYSNLDAQVGGGGLSWLPATFRNDLKSAPACLYLNRHKSDADTGLELFVLTKALLDIHDGVATPLPELAGIQNATITYKDQKYSMLPSPGGNENPICDKSKPSTCWLYYASVMAEVWQDPNFKKNPEAELCNSLNKALSQTPGVIGISCSNPRFAQLVNLFSKLNKSIDEFRAAETDDDKRKAEKEVLASIVEYSAITSLIVEPKEPELKKWLTLWADINLGDYNQASIDLMADLECKLSSVNAGDTTGASDEPGRNASVCHAIVLAGALSQAKTSDDVKALLVANTLPADAWRLRSRQTMWDFGAIVGGRYEVVHTASLGISTNTSGGGVAAPIGLSVTAPINDNLILGAMVSLIDVGGAFSYGQSTQQGAATVQPTTSLSSLAAPGLILRMQHKSLPITLMVGRQYTNAARAAILPNGTQQNLSGYKDFIGIGFDMPLLLIR